MIALKVLDESDLPAAVADAPANCDGCGACCEGMSSPPGYVIYFPLAGQQIQDWALDPVQWPDAALWPNVPESLKHELAEYYAHARAQIEAGVSRAEAYRDGEPCCWYDPVSKRCKHYEHRPQTCRDFQLGEASCLAYRSDAGLTSGLPSGSSN